MAEYNSDSVVLNNINATQKQLDNSLVQQTDSLSEINKTEKGTDNFT